MCLIFLLFYLILVRLCMVSIFLLIENIEIKNLKADIEFILEQEDTQWKQRAKQNRYQYGDRNT